MKEWVEELNNNTEEKIITIIVGNKKDMSDMRQVTIEEAKQYALSVGAADYVETSAKTKEGIDETFDLISGMMAAESQSNIPEPEETVNPGNPQNPNRKKIDDECCF
eukprot:TRINITY_DN873_c0_g1_i1.p1 TRINITY_DN873_c0_g1~~TRINITY_DN873_c0_g1_i1.p1  ORF type:complete len:107 (+),score=32.35 TRINITY_DN873_c0_g1_i1:769-1089(+)